MERNTPVVEEVGNRQTAIRRFWAGKVNSREADVTDGSDAVQRRTGDQAPQIARNGNLQSK